jgi:hypothetical protein
MSKRNSNKLTCQLAQRSRKRRDELATETRLAEASERRSNDPLPEMKLESRLELHRRDWTGSSAVPPCLSFAWGKCRRPTWD